jgi:hypothetical protein
MFSRAKILTVIGAATILTVWGVAMDTPPANAELVRHSAPGDLFYNQYVPPAGPGSVGAELYPSPRPTPPRVGHTYITYPPLAPQEFLYKHHRKYTTVHEDAPNTRTRVHWR